MRIIANETPEPVRSEFRRIAESQALGLPLTEAVEKMAQRVPVSETNFFAIVIGIQAKSGGNLSEAIGNLSRTLRERKKMKGKINAMSMEAKASAAIIGAVPFIVTGLLYVSSPNYISLLWSTEHGRIVAAIAIFWMSIGVVMMQQDDQLRLLNGPAMLDVVFGKLGDGAFPGADARRARLRATALTVRRADAAERQPVAPHQGGRLDERERIRQRERETPGGRARARRSCAPAPSIVLKSLVDALNLTSWLSTETAKETLAQGRLPRRRGRIRLRRLPPRRADRLRAVRRGLHLLHRQLAAAAADRSSAASMAAVYLGIKAPEIYLRNATTKRQKSIERAYPNTLDLMLICAELGMSIEHAVRKVSSEIGVESVEMAEEMTLLAAEMSYLQDRRTAFENLNARTGLELIRSLTTVLIQSERYGTPLGAALRVLGQESRDQRMNAAEKKAAALPPTLTVPMILFFLPGLFAAILTPGGDPDQPLELTAKRGRGARRFPLRGAAWRSMIRHGPRIPLQLRSGPIRPRPRRSRGCRRAPPRISAPRYLAGLNPEQRRAVEALDGPVLVLAGAGVGKTRVLTTRIAHLIASGRARPHEILAVTFTNKAAREMRERVEPLTGVAEGMPWLGTFHSIGAKILRRHAELVGLKPNFTILDTDDQIRLLKQVLQAENIDDKRWPARALAA